MAHAAGARLVVAMDSWLKDSLAFGLAAKLVENLAWRPYAIIVYQQRPLGTTSLRFGRQWLQSKGHTAMVAASAYRLAICIPRGVDRFCGAAIGRRKENGHWLCEVRGGRRNI